jgi:hypothetical protein
VMISKGGSHCVCGQLLTPRSRRTIRYSHNVLPVLAARYIHVSIMIFVGFGFLMTFLKRYSNSAVALNFFTSCLVCAAS